MYISYATIHNERRNTEQKVIDFPRPTLWQDLPHPTS